MSREDDPLEDELRALRERIAVLRLSAIRSQADYQQWAEATERELDLRRSLLLQKGRQCVFPFSHDAHLLLWDLGAPWPEMVYKDRHATLSYNIDKQAIAASESRERAIIEFKEVSFCRIGRPGENDIVNHAYWKEGLEGLCGGVVLNSKLIQTLALCEGDSSNYAKEYWNNMNHYVFCFKDELAEIVCQEFAVSSHRAG